MTSLRPCDKLVTLHNFLGFLRNILIDLNLVHIQLCFLNFA